MVTYVNEIAVIATTCVMVAVAMVWYSEYLFQKPWMRAVGLTKDDMEAAEQYMRRNVLITIVSYAVVIYLIGALIGLAQVFGVAVQHLALALAAGFAALLAGFVVWEQRSLTYFVVTVGFSTVFIFGSTFILFYWPW